MSFEEKKDELQKLWDEAKFDELYNEFEPIYKAESQNVEVLVRLRFFVFFVFAIFVFSATFNWSTPNLL